MPMPNLAKTMMSSCFFGIVVPKKDLKHIPQYPEDARRARAMKAWRAVILAGKVSFLTPEYP